MDPMSRILLEKAYEAVVDAGTYLFCVADIDSVRYVEKYLQETSKILIN